MDKKRVLRPRTRNTKTGLTSSYPTGQEDCDSSTESIPLSQLVDKDIDKIEKTPISVTPRSKMKPISIVDLTTPKETPTRRITRRMSIELTPVAASPLRRSGRIVASEERSDNRSIGNKKCYVRVLNVKENYLKEVAEEVIKNESADLNNTANKKSESEIENIESNSNDNQSNVAGILNVTRELFVEENSNDKSEDDNKENLENNKSISIKNQSNLDGIPKVTREMLEEKSNDKSENDNEEGEINETQKANSQSKNISLSQSKAVTFNESSSIDTPSKKSYIKTPHSSKNQATNVTNHSNDDDSFKQLVNKETEKLHSSASEDAIPDKENSKNKLDVSSISKITPNKKKRNFSLPSSTPLNPLKMSVDNSNSLPPYNHREKSDKHTFAKSWNTVIHGKNTEKIDEYNLATEKCEVVKTKSKKYIPSSDEEIENEEIERNEFIDDAALCVDGESMDEEEKQYLKENEIPENGISIGSEDSENISTDEEKQNECDSFVVSDGETELLSVSEKFSEDEESIHEQDSKTKKNLKSSVISISDADEEEIFPKRKKKTTIFKQELDFSDEDNDIEANSSHSKSVDKHNFKSVVESKLNEITKSQTELGTNDEQPENNFQVECNEKEDENENSNFEKLPTSPTSSSNIIASNKSLIESSRNISLTETNKSLSTSDKNDVTENLELSKNNSKIVGKDVGKRSSRKFVTDSELEEARNENNDKSYTSKMSASSTKRLSKDYAGAIIENDKILKLTNYESKNNKSDDGNEKDSITASQDENNVISTEINQLNLSENANINEANKLKGDDEYFDDKSPTKSKDLNYCEIYSNKSNSSSKISENIEKGPEIENSNTNNDLNVIESPIKKTKRLLEYNSPNSNGNHQNKNNNKPNGNDEDLNETKKRRKRSEIFCDDNDLTNKSYEENNIGDNKTLRNNSKEIEEEEISTSSSKRKRDPEDSMSKLEPEHKKKKNMQLNESYTIETTEHSYKEVKIFKNDEKAKRKSLPASTSKENKNLYNKKQRSLSPESNQIQRITKKSTKNPISASEDNLLLPQSKKIFNVEIIKNKCDEILEKANQAKLKEKLLKQSTTRKKDITKKNKKLEHCTKNKAIEKAVLHSKKIFEQRIDYENKQAMKIRNQKETRLLPSVVLESIGTKNSKLIKDEDKTVFDLNNKKSKRTIKSEEEVSSIISSSGSFQVEPVTPKRSEKKIISTQKLPSGTVFEEYLSPKCSANSGFIESQMTPKNLGYKVRRMISAGQEVPFFKKEEKKIKRKINLSDPVTILPKPTWTCSGDWIEKTLKTKEKISMNPVHLNMNSTKFSVSTLNSDKIISKDYLNINKALEFKKSALKNNENILESSKHLLRRKQRQKINNKF